MQKSTYRQTNKADNLQAVREADKRVPGTMHEGRMKPIEETHPTMKDLGECGNTVFCIADIQEHTIDKQKVREAFRVIGDMAQNGEHDIEVIDKYWKELGL